MPINFDSELRIDPEKALRNPLFFYDNINWSGWDDRYTYHPGNKPFVKQSDSMATMTGDWYQYQTPPFNATYYSALALSSSYYVRNVYEFTGNFQGKSGDALESSQFLSLTQYAEWQNRQTNETAKLKIYTYNSPGYVFTSNNFEVAPPMTLIGSDLIVGSSGNDRIAGYGGADRLEGSEGNDTLYGDGRSEFIAVTGEAISSVASRAVDGADILKGGGGNDRLIGGDGLDVAVFEGSRSQYRLTGVGSNALEVFDQVAGRDGVDTLSSMERLQFADVSIALDVSGNAGKVAKILGAVFGSAVVSNKAYVGIGLSYLDGGMSYQELAALALSAAGSTSNDAIVTRLWINLVGSPPSDANKTPFLTMLNSGTSVAALVVLAADHEVNSTNIGLVGLSQTGIEYV
jgi:hypothetical protein